MLFSQRLSNIGAERQGRPLGPGHPRAIGGGALAKHKRRHEREQVVNLPLSSVNRRTLSAVMIARVSCKFPQVSDWFHIE